MTGEQLYEAYREERIQQGWQEFLWKSMSKPQQLVWDKLALRLQPVPTEKKQHLAPVTTFARRD